MVKVKHLEITNDDWLSWNSHIDVLCVKLSLALFLLRRMKSIGSALTAKRACHSLLGSLSEVVYPLGICKESWF